jgi:hypothetical protein
MSDDLSVGVTEVRDNSEGRLRERSPKTETLVDVERGIFVRLGIPETNGAIIVPENPHVFVADELRIRDKDNDEEMLLKDVVVLMGHGVRNQNDKWGFLGGQSVPDTLNAYNQYAKKEGMPEAEFLVVCNKDRTAEEIGAVVLEGDIGNTIAYPAGTEVDVTGVIEPDGKIRVYVQSKEKISNLDILQTSKDTKTIDQ